MSLQRATLKRLDEAYQGFFRRVSVGRRPGFPRFRGKRRFDSFGFREFEGITLRNCRLRFGGMPGRLRIHLHRPLPERSTVKCCTFRRQCGVWSVSFSVEVDPMMDRVGGRAVGVDLGLTTFAAFSDGGHLPSLKAARRGERRLRLAQRALARKMSASKGREKARMAVTRAHRAIARRRADYLHQASARLIRDYDAVAIEAINVNAMSRSALAKAVRDAAWGKFISMLRYKAEWAGVRLIEVNPYNTTQECSGCGSHIAKSLDDRLHVCFTCGLDIDRDLNAARNILQRAGLGPCLRNVVGDDMRADGNIGSRASA